MGKRAREKRKKKRQQRRQARSAAVRAESQRIARRQSAYRESQAANKEELFRALAEIDGNAGTRRWLNAVAEHMSEYAGIPMPLESEQLIIEKSYPFAEILTTVTHAQVNDENDDWPEIRSKFYCHGRRSMVATYVDPDTGKVKGALMPQFHHIAHDLRTMACSDAWGIEQEHNALQTLATMIPHSKFKRYLLTSMFMEQSKRSGIMYVFRKLRPTVALRMGTHKDREQVTILCTLCMHPIGYYRESWAGAMCPTDDVIAHLSLMRADEHAFWKKSNQTRPHFPEAGL